MKLAPSILSADFGNLRAEAQAVEPLAHCFHIDVMDGHFVPNLTIGPPVVNSLRIGLDKPFDIHLMIEYPLQYAQQFKVSPSDMITFHIEASNEPFRAVELIRGLGCKVGLSLRPVTPITAVFPYLDILDLVLVMSVEPGFGGQAFMPEALERITTLRKEIGDRQVMISVDGGINDKNVKNVVDAGAELIVAGSSIFGHSDRVAAMRALIKAASNK